jgi:hypothetical protein
MPAVLTTLFARYWPALGIAGALLIGWLYVSHLRSTVETQADEINTLAVNLRAEQDARKRDVAGLTTLSKGLTQVATDTKRDATILAETINASNPAPASPRLSDFLRGLREADAAAVPASPAGRAGSAPAKPTSGSR